MLTGNRRNWNGNIDIRAWGIKQLTWLHSSTRWTNHRKADRKQQCDRDANDATNLLDAELHNFDAMRPRPNGTLNKTLSLVVQRTIARQEELETQLCSSTFWCRWDIYAGLSFLTRLRVSVHSQEDVVHDDVIHSDHVIDLHVQCWCHSQWLCHFTVNYGFHSDDVIHSDHAVPNDVIHIDDVSHSYDTVIHFYFGGVQFLVQRKFAVSVRRNFRLRWRDTDCVNPDLKFR